LKMKEGTWAMMLLKRIRRNKADKLLAQGKVNEAILLFQTEKAWDGLMVAYEKLGDFASAAEAAKKAQYYESAARLFESAGLFAQAAEMWLQLSNKERAAADLEKANDFGAAADLYESLEMYSRAAAAWGAACQYAKAGESHERAGELTKAVEVYRAANQLGEIARVFEESGDLEGAARVHCELGAKAKAAELFARAHNPVESAQCHLELGNFKAAGDLLFDSGHLLEAAEAYENDEHTLKKSAQLFSAVFRPGLAWQKELQGAIVCSDVSQDGRFITVGAARKLRMFNGTGEPVWRFVPTWGGKPCCLALSGQGSVALGCDDGQIYMVDAGKTVQWTTELPGDAVKIGMDSSGECIVCSTKENLVVCLDKEGTVAWEYRPESLIWDVAVSPDGKFVAIGTADGSCIIKTDRGEDAGVYKAHKWVHSVSIGDGGTRVALGIGMDGVELLDGRNLQPVWSMQDGSPVHNVVLTPDGAVMSVGDDEVLMRDGSGTVVWRYTSENRLLGGGIDSKQRMAIFRCAGKKLIRVDLHDCKARAAASYAKSADFGVAARLYEAIEDYENAAAMFKEAGDYSGAARTIELAGHPLEAAELYVQADDLLRAAQLCETAGNLGKSAQCFARVGQPLKAAELYEKAGDLARAAELFEQAGEYGRAGKAYEASGNISAAVGALTQHVNGHADDVRKHLELGLLLQEDGQYDNAIEHFQLSAATDELRAESARHVAECFLQKDMYEIAIERYKACLGKDEAVSRENIEIFYGLGKAYHLAGDYHEAKRTYESILAVDYRYKDVITRLEDAGKLSNVFEQRTTAAAAGRTMIVDEAFQQLSSDKKERYVPIRKLGEGGMGTVYLAEDRRLNRKVALKMLPASLRSDEQMTLRIIREAQMVAQVTHPNVVAVFDVGEEQGAHYVSMEYVEGETIRHILETKGPFDPGDCVRLLLQVTDGLACAHGKKVAHRDIKPENVMVTKDGTAKIMDFGLALVEGATRMTMPGGICGTPFYMAPEQLRGDEHLGPAVDVYAVGCMAYELLTGNPPFTEGNIGAQHLNTAPKSLSEIRPEVPAQLETVIMRCLEKDAADRYPDGASLNYALREVEKAL